MMDVESVGAGEEYEDDEDHEPHFNEEEGRANVDSNLHHTRGGHVNPGLENTVWNAADVTEYDE